MKPLCLYLDKSNQHSNQAPDKRMKKKALVFPQRLLLLVVVLTGVASSAIISAASITVVVVVVVAWIVIIIWVSISVAIVPISITAGAVAQEIHISIQENLQIAPFSLDESECAAESTSSCPTSLMS